MKIALIIPTYNEKGNIENLIDILEKEVFPKIKNHDMHIVVVDDTSPDGTADTVKELIKKYKNLHIIENGLKEGLGAAYVRGMTLAIEKLDPDVMFEMDADLSHDPDKIPAFIKKIEDGCDMVIGTRYSDGGSIPEDWGITRKAYSVIGNLIVRLILMRFSIHDWTGGYRALKKEVFLKERSELKGFKGYTFQVAFLHKAVKDGYKIGEVPFHFSDRKVGGSKIAPAEYIVDLLRYVIKSRVKEIVTGPFGKFLVVGGIGFILNAVILKVLVDEFKWAPYVANLAGAVVAIFSNYNFNNVWTFKEHKVTNFSTYIVKLIHFYVTSAFGVIVIQTGTIFVGVHYITSQKDYFIYFLLGTAFIMIWNFFIYSKFIWKKRKHL